MKRSRRQMQVNPLPHAKIPEAIQYELAAVGGVRGLCERIPSPKSIEKMSATHHALSDPIRLTILFLLAVQPLCVCVIKVCVKIADSKLSYHLTVLKKADLIKGEQQGNWIIYRLTEKGRTHTKEMMSSPIQQTAH